MKVWTVKDCDRLAHLELAIANSVYNAAEVETHLNRAAAFSHCSEQGRRNALLSGAAAGSDASCCPHSSGLLSEELDSVKSVNRFPSVSANAD